MHVLRFPMFVLLAVIFSIPAFQIALGQTNSNPAPKAEAPSQTDLNIQKQVRSVFGEIDDFRNIFVTVKGGVVTIKGRVLELDQVTRAEELASKIPGVVTINNKVDVETSVEKRITPALERFFDRVTQIVGLLPIIIVGIIVFGLVSTVGFLIARMKYPWDVLTPNRFIANLLRQLIRLGFIVLGIVLALDIMGATALLRTILGAAGILGLAIGFAVRDTVENYIASILLSFRQPFRPRDCVAIAGHEGFVIALTSRATVIMTYDGNHVRIPNATVFKGIITNYSLNPERRFDFEIGVETDDLKRAVDLGIETISGLSFVLSDPAPDGWVNKIGDSSILIWFGGWINQNETSLVKARAEAIRLIKQKFESEGILMPEPIYRVRMDGENEIKQVKSKSPKKSHASEPIDAQSGTLDVSPDRQLEQKVLEAEQRNKDEDLMNDEAPQEISN